MTRSKDKIKPKKVQKHYADEHNQKYPMIPHHRHLCPKHYLVDFKGHGIIVNHKDEVTVLDYISNHVLLCSQNY